MQVRNKINTNIANMKKCTSYVIFSGSSALKLQNGILFVGSDFLFINARFTAIASSDVISIGVSGYIIPTNIPQMHCYVGIDGIVKTAVVQHYDIAFPEYAGKNCFVINSFNIESDQDLVLSVMIPLR